MKKNTGKTCLTVAALAFSVMGSQAAVLLSENFDGLATGSDLTAAGWAWDAGQTVIQVIDQGGGDKAAQGTADAWNTYSIGLSTPVNSGLVFLTVDVEANAATLRQYVGLSEAALGSSGSDNYRVGQDYTLGNENFWIRPGGNWGNSSDTGAAAGALPNTMVTCLDVAAGTVYFWANPDGTDFFDSADGGTADASLTDAKFDGTFSHFFINGYNTTYDNIVVGTEGADVGMTVVPEPASLGLLGLAFGGLAALRRRK